MSKLSLIAKFMSPDRYHQIGQEMIENAPANARVAHESRGFDNFVSTGELRNPTNEEVEEAYAILDGLQRKAYETKNRADQMRADNFRAHIMRNISPSVEHMEETMAPTRMTLDEPMYIQRHNALFRENNTPPKSGKHYSASVVDPNDWEGFDGPTFQQGSEHDYLYRLDPGQEVFNTMGLADPNEVVVMGDELRKAFDSGRGMYTDEYYDLYQKGKPAFAVTMGPAGIYQSRSLTKGEPEPPGVLEPAGPLPPQTDPNAPIGTSENMGTMSALPPTTLENIAGLLGQARDYMNRGQISESVPLLGGTGYGDLFLEGIPEYWDKVAGEGLVKGKGQTARLNLPPEMGLLNSAFLGLDLAGLGALGTMAAKTGFRSLDDIINATARAELDATSTSLDDILRGQNYIPSLEPELSYKAANELRTR